MVAHRKESRAVRRGRRAGGAHEALPHTPSGGVPPETPGASACLPLVGPGIAEQKRRTLDTDPGRQSAEDSPREMVAHRRKSRAVRRGQRAGGAHEALPHTPPGGKPPETPGPLSLLPQYPGGRESVKGSQAAQKTRALDRFPPSRASCPIIRERGPADRRLRVPPVGRPRNCEKKGGGHLTEAGLLMEAATVRERMRNYL